MNIPLVQNLIIGISGASGVIYGIRLLEMLKDLSIQTHLIITEPGLITAAYETPYKLKDIQALATHNYQDHDIAAGIASGSFPAQGMIIAPCSMRTLAEIATGVTTNLLSRAADVMLKERKRLALMVRETPLHSGHLRNMLTVSDLGGIIYPPVPAFYNDPETLDDMITHTTGRILDLFGLDCGKLKRWKVNDKII